VFSKINQWGYKNVHKTKYIAYEGKQNFCMTKKTNNKEIWQKDVPNIFIHNRNNKR
jgi:hypothetical protein